MTSDLFAPATRADQIFKRFVAFHDANPTIWELYQKFALQLVGAGRKRYSSLAIMMRIRWHVEVETKGDSVKINNDFAAYYARMFAAKFPEHRKFFGFRHRTSVDSAAYNNDIHVFDSGPVGDEQTLINQLRGMA